MTRTYWLSFVNEQRPPGHRFQGVAVVDVTDQDAMEALVTRPDMHDKQEGPWIAAAMRAAWKHGCNPGGQVGSVRIDGIDGFDVSQIPRNKLLSKMELEALGLIHAEVVKES